MIFKDQFPALPAEAFVLRGPAWGGASAVLAAMRFDAAAHLPPSALRPARGGYVQSALHGEDDGGSPPAVARWSAAGAPLRAALRDPGGVAWGSSGEAMVDAALRAARQDAAFLFAALEGEALHVEVGRAEWEEWERSPWPPLRARASCPSPRLEAEFDASPHLSAREAAAAAAAGWRGSAPGDALVRVLWRSARLRPGGAARAFLRKAMALEEAGFEVPVGVGVEPAAGDAWRAALHALVDLPPAGGR